MYKHATGSTQEWSQYTLATTHAHTRAHTRIPNDIGYLDTVHCLYYSLLNNANGSFIKKRLTLILICLKTIGLCPTYIENIGKGCVETTS